jgi:uncharacterized ferritin-like protein (DUF455 family)
MFGDVVEKWWQVFMGRRVTDTGKNFQRLARKVAATGEQ